MTFYGNSDNVEHAGFIAQEVLPLIPMAVGTNPADGYYTLDNTSILSYAVKALQQQQQEITDLQHVISQLKTQMTTFSSKSSGSSPRVTTKANGRLLDEIAPSPSLSDGYIVRLTDNADLYDAHAPDRHALVGPRFFHCDRVWELHA